MKIFIFETISQCSSRHHSKGGLVIIADDINAAKQLISGNKYISITDKEWEGVESFELSQTVTPKYWVMPDAGCC